MTAHEIRLSGCDAGTEFVMDLSDTEADLLRRISERSVNASEYECMPRLYVKPLPDQEVTP